MPSNLLFPSLIDSLSIMWCILGDKMVNKRQGPCPQGLFNLCWKMDINQIITQIRILLQTIISGESMGSEGHPRLEVLEEVVTLEISTVRPD